MSSASPPPSVARPPAPARERPAAPRGARGVLSRAGRVVGSFGFAVVLLLALMVNVLYGTFAQGSTSLYDVQAEYFESWVTSLDIWGVPVPWLGAMAILALLSLNLIVGGVIRLRRGWATAGILVAHLGVLMLFAGSLVETVWSQKGQMTVWEQDGKAQFQSYDEWEVVIRERKDGGAREWILDADEVRRLEEGGLTRFTHADLPFDVALAGWERSSEPVPAPRGTRPEDTADGWVLEPRAVAMENSANLPGGWVTLVPKGGGKSVRSILWGGQSHFEIDGNESPWVATVAGRRFELDLRTKRWELPFRIELKRFVKRDYPGTSMVAEYSSYVTKVEAGTLRDVHITMNEPLRHRGYTLYQSGWGPQMRGIGRGPPWYSTFAVVHNPTDRVPEISCYVIAVGLLFHFLFKLFRYLDAESVRRRAKEAA